jgi:NAD(P)-dependent dehydrogenase (short-subunit alcohol dehydrogenase family)
MAPVNFSLEGEAALVTGAASGIGKAIAQAIAA